MAAYQVPQKIIPRFLLAAGAASGSLIFLCFFFSGPLLGPHYDFLMRRRPPPPVSREVVLIEAAPGLTTQPASSFIEPADVSAMLMTLTELGARGLAVPAPGLRAARAYGRAIGHPAETEVSRHLDEEFSLLAGNIRNLFQAILMGSVPPEEAEHYVDTLIGLSEQGKERLFAVLARKDNPVLMRAVRAAAAFGLLWEADGVRVSPDETPEGSSALYSRSSPDRDGVFRRIYPLAPGLAGTGHRAEHVVYAMLNHYLGPADIEYRQGMPLLRFKREGFVRDIALDSRGAVLAERPRGNGGFARLTPEDFAEYERADREFARFLDTLRERGCFIYLTPEADPAFLYEYSHRKREELLENTGDQPLMDMKARWLDARAGYLRGLENFAAGPSETLLVMSCERRIAAEGLADEELRRLVSQRNGVISDFAAFREKYDALLRIRSGLSSALAGSFCILGPAAPPPPDSAGFSAGFAGPETGAGNFLTRHFRRLFPAEQEPVPSDTEVSAMLANTILSGRAVEVPPGHAILVRSLLPVLLILFLIRRTGPVLTLVFGLAMTALTAAVFSGGFILTGYWIDPVIPAGSALAGTLASFLFILSTKRRDQGSIRRRRGGAVGPAYLKRLVRVGPLAGEGEILQEHAAIVAVRRGGLLAAESGKDPLDSAGEIRAFREAAARRFTRAGGVIVGIDGDMVLAAFGSPVERIAVSSAGKETPYDDGPAPGHPSPEALAAGFVVALLKEEPETAAWRFGIDAGNCAFGYSEISGYAAFGRPVVHARILSGIAPRYHARILITAGVNGGITGFPTRKLDTITSPAGKEKEPFYEIRLS
jgi:class 3 adenylate cyclase